MTSILLEGGPKLAGAFLDAGELDELRLFLAPVVVGGSNARDPLEGEGVERIAPDRPPAPLDLGQLAPLRAALSERLTELRALDQPASSRPTSTSRPAGRWRG